MSMLFSTKNNTPGSLINGGIHINFQSFFGATLKLLKTDIQEVRFSYSSERVKSCFSKKKNFLETMISDL